MAPVIAKSSSTRWAWGTSEMMAKESQTALCPRHQAEHFVERICSCNPHTSPRLLLILLKGELKHRKENDILGACLLGSSLSSYEVDFTVFPTLNQTPSPIEDQVLASKPLCSENSVLSAYRKHYSFSSLSVRSWGLKDIRMSHNR